MLDGGLCMECLGSQFYDPMTQTCKTCHESCRSCSGPGQYSCVACAFPLHLDRLNNQCVPCCPTGALKDDQSCCHCDKDTGMCHNTKLNLHFIKITRGRELKIKKIPTKLAWNIIICFCSPLSCESNEEKWKWTCEIALPFFGSWHVLRAHCCRVVVCSLSRDTWIKLQQRFT